MTRSAPHGPGSSSRHQRPQASLAFLCDQNVPEPVVRLFEGRGFAVKRARDVGLAAAQDADVREVCLAFTPQLTVVTTDPDFREAALRGGVSVVFLRPPETTARARLQGCFDDVISDLLGRQPVVTVTRTGILLDRGRRRPRRRR